MSLGLSLSCSLRQAHSYKGPDDWDLIGNQLWLAILFARSDFDTDLELYDEVRAERLPAGEIFEKAQDGLWTMRQDSIPGVIEIKAIGVTTEKLMVETSPVHSRRLTGVIKERNFQVRFNSSRRCLVRTDKTVLARLSEMRPKTNDLEPRILWTLPWTEFEDGPLRDLVTTIEGLLNDDVWITQDRPEAGLDPRAKQMEMRQTLSLQLQLQVEQRPELMLDGEMQGIQIMDVQQILALQFRLLRMSDEELLAFAAEHPTRALNAMLFTLAGKVKKIQPELTWKQARCIARKAVNKAG